MNKSTYKNTETNYKLFVRQLHNENRFYNRRAYKIKYIHDRYYSLSNRIRRSLDQEYSHEISCDHLKSLQEIEQECRLLMSSYEKSILWLVNVRKRIAFGVASHLPGKILLHNCLMTGKQNIKHKRIMYNTLNKLLSQMSKINEQDYIKVSSIRSHNLKLQQLYRKHQNII